MIGIHADIQNLKSFKKAMASSEVVLARGLWHGTSRSLGGFRKDFLAKTPANIRGKKSGNAGGAGASSQPPPIGRSFRWQMFPPTPPGGKFGSSGHVKTVKSVSGEIGTRSTAAESMEEGGVITASGPYLGIPIVKPGNDNAKRRRSGELRPRAKPSWRKTADILKKTAYNFQFQVKGTYTILWARHKKTEAKPFPVMLLIKRIEMKKDGLEFFKIFEKMKPETLRRYDKEIIKQLDRLVYGINKKGK